MKYRIYYLVLSAVIFIAACNKKLDVAPQSTLTPDQIQSADDVKAVLFGAYATLQNANGLDLKYIKGSNEKDFFSVNFSFNIFLVKPPAGLNAQNKGSKKTLLLMAGYHRRFKKFYTEPQAGVGVYSGRLFEPEFGIPSQGVFCWGFETGYFIRRFSVQAKYQAVHTKENILLGRFFYYGVIGLAYQLSSNSK